MRRQRLKRTRASKKVSSSPSFDSGLMAEPLLAFGGGHEHVDPRTGLALYGPYTMTGQTEPVLSSIRVGLVGPAAMVADTEQWLVGCRSPVLNDGSNPFEHPPFPGFNAEHPFKCELLLGSTWQETLRDRDLRDALSPANYFECIKRVIEAYAKGIATLTGRDPHPDVVLCCIPQEVIGQCTTRTTRTGVEKRVKLGTAERSALRVARTGQTFLFREQDPTLGLDEEPGSHQNLRRGLKAEAMRYRMPTQLVWPRTIVRSAGQSDSESTAEDPATRAWNFTAALYHKAGGSPWRLSDVEPGTCHVGISFYRELSSPVAELRTSMAQAFTAAGDGYVLRGDSFEWNESARRQSPHMDAKTAAALMTSVLDLYKRQNRGSLPSRLVVHKSSRYWDEEFAGLMEASSMVPRKDFISIGGPRIQFYRPGMYPALRGTYVKLSADDLLLYTVGYVPFLRTYPGSRVPQPIEVQVHHADSPWTVVLQDALALTKMNWNTTYFACSRPVTLAFSQRVGQILAELPPDLEPMSEYRFYM